MCDRDDALWRVFSSYFSFVFNFKETVKAERERVVMSLKWNCINVKELDLYSISNCKELKALLPLKLSS